MTLTKKNLTETLYLSCAENYFLAWLGKIYDVTKLYGCAFIGMDRLFDDFCRGAKYENYEGIPRLQEVAEEYDIVRHEYLRCPAEEAVRILREQPQDILCLARVNKNFFAGYKRTAWREDHYICIDRDLHWLNQYPLSEGEYDLMQFDSVYGGSLALYRLSGLNTELPDLIGEAIAGQTFSALRVPEDAENMESAVGILRVTRKRMAEYYARHERVFALLKKEIALLDDIYFLLRLQQTRKQKVLVGADKIKDSLGKVYGTEKEIAEVLRNGKGKTV